MPRDTPSNGATDKVSEKIEGVLSLAALAPTPDMRQAQCDFAPANVDYSYHAVVAASEGSLSAGHRSAGYNSD